VQHMREHAGEAPPFSAKYQDMQVFLFGDTAVAVYVRVNTARAGANLPWQVLRSDSTDVFTKSSGGWKLRMSRGSTRSDN
jgi:hypothetical protein